MPLFVVDAMGSMPGLPGIFVSGIFSASLSSVSAAMNSLAAVTLEDYIKVRWLSSKPIRVDFSCLFVTQPLYLHIRKKPLMESKSTLPSKITACLYGIVCIAVAFLGKVLNSKTWQTIKINILILKFAAQYLGGILQASLTIFGVVGGPLFGMFTLGMFTQRGNQRVSWFFSAKLFFSKIIDFVGFLGRNREFVHWRGIFAMDWI